MSGYTSPWATVSERALEELDANREKSRNYWRKDIPVGEYEERIPPPPLPAPSTPMNDRILKEVKIRLGRVDARQLVSPSFTTTIRAKLQQNVMPNDEELITIKEAHDRTHFFENGELYQIRHLIDILPVDVMEINSVGANLYRIHSNTAIDSDLEKASSTLVGVLQAPPRVLMPKESQAILDTLIELRKLQQVDEMYTPYEPAPEVSRVAPEPKNEPPLIPNANTQGGTFAPMGTPPGLPQEYPTEPSEPVDRMEILEGLKRAGLKSRHLEKKLNNKPYTPRKKRTAKKKS